MAKIDDGICRGQVCTFQISIWFSLEALESTFPKVIAQFAHKGPGVQACEYVLTNHSVACFSRLKSAQMCPLL